MKKNKIYFFIVISLLAPAVSFAALDGIKGMISEIGKLVSMIIPIVMGLALVYFFWGIAQFVLHDAGNDKTREEGKKKMLWGIIALFVMMSIYGIVAFIGNTLGIKTGVGSSPDVCVEGMYADGSSCQ
jgi:hypothetical protein